MAEIMRKLALHEMNLWDGFMLKHHSYPFHLRSYVKALTKNKWTFDYVVLMDEENDVRSAVLIQKRRIPATPFFITYLPYTPIGDDLELGSKLIAHVIKVYKPLSIKMTLQLQTPHSINHQSFVKGLEHFTFLVDLMQDEDFRFDNYSKTYRNCIRKAIKENVVVSFVQSEEEIDLFLKMYHSMTDRKDIEPIDHDMMKEIMSGLLKSNQALLAKTTYLNQDYNYAFVSINGLHARYLYGASIPQSGLPPMGQYLHHEIMNELMRRHVETYDLGGIVSSDVDEDDPTYGVYKFKKGFGGVPEKIATEYIYKRFKFL